MATKQRKKTSRKRKKVTYKKIWFSFLLGITLGIGLLSILLFVAHKLLTKKTENITYEDFSCLHLEDQILLITQELERQFSQIGIKKWQEKVTSRIWGKNTYPFIEMEIKKGKELSWVQIKKALLELVQRQREISFQFTSFGPNTWDIYLAWHGLITHHLIFKPKISIKSTYREKPLVALIVDDIGYKEMIVNQFLALDIPLTFSILPYSPHGRQIAEKLKDKKGIDLMLHLPLEANGHPKLNKQPGMLLLSMSPALIRTKLKQDLAAVPYIKGVNNHMGSKFTQNKKYMKLILTEIKQRHLFFVDSLTTNKSVGYKLARQMGIPALKRDIFLDATRNINEIKARIGTLKRWARAKGKVVVICHPYLPTLMVLKGALPELKREVRFVTVSSLLEHNGLLSSRMSKASCCPF